MVGTNFEKQPCVYILTSRNRKVLYIGVTSQLKQRVWQHKHKVSAGFTAKYNVCDLVYYELFGSMKEAIEREKQLKRWRRSWKDELIVSMNPRWDDLYESL
ncbi:GIY-YIG nuclease family protein [Vibrio olivae]|uniref:GIY-YIG nuclease family protein n=1 Tax=Vibrio olivae TaxID=1243002 RepID=A0ABV5HQA9_9VIBR